MSYLRFRNWKRYQNADLAKKSHGGLAWVKLWTIRDEELMALTPTTRLLFYELLKLAGREMNAIPNYMNFISGHTGLTLKQTVNGVQTLLEGAWLSETKTKRNSRNESRKVSRVTLDREVEVEVEEESSKAFVDEAQIAEVRSLVDRSLRSVG